MNTFCEIITGSTGGFLLFLAFASDTKNLRSTIVFKFIPFILGCGNIFVMLYMLDIIKLNLK
jgi:hypothetical protein